MVRNIIFAIALLIFVNWLLNLARINELKREIDQIEVENEYLQQQITIKRSHIDSLERAIIDTMWKYKHKLNSN